MTGLCLVTAVSNTTGGKQQDSLYLSFSSHTHRAVWPHVASVLFITHTQKDKKRQQIKSSLMAACLAMECIRKADSSKVQPWAWTWTTRGIFTGILSLSSVREWHTSETNGKCDMLFTYFLFTFFISFPSSVASVKTSCPSWTSSLECCYRVCSNTFLNFMLTGSGDLLLWSSGGGVTVISWGGAKAESLLLLTSRGVSGTRTIRVRDRGLDVTKLYSCIICWHDTVMF